MLGYIQRHPYFWICHLKWDNPGTITISGCVCGRIVFKTTCRGCLRGLGHQVQGGWGAEFFWLHLHKGAEGYENRT